MYFKNKTEKGYTLIELIVSVVLISIVSSILVYVMGSIAQVIQENRTKKELILDGYNATSKFVREFEIIDDEGDIVIGNLNQIRFISNVGGVYYTIQYQFVGSELQRTVDAGAPAIVSTNASGTFEYYQKDFVQITPPLSLAQLLTVRHVRLNLTLSSGGNSYSYIADVFPENYRFSGGGS